MRHIFPRILKSGLGGLLVVSCLLLPLSAAAAASAPVLPEHRPLLSFPDKDRTSAGERRVVRIGWFSQYGNFHSKDNALWGYLPALFEALDHFVDWDIQWVQVGLENVTEKLAAGEIDLACGMTWTPERAQHFQYSNIRAGIYATTLHVPHDSPVHYMDFKDFENLRIGFYTGSYHYDIFKNIAQKNNFSFQPVFYSTAADIKRDLAAGTLDGYVDGSPVGRKTKVAGIFDSRPFYFVSSKDDTYLIPHVNEVLNRLQIFNPRPLANFFNTFIDPGNPIDIALDREEKEWLRTRPTLRVALSAGEDTPSQGNNLFLQNFVARIAQNMGISLEYVAAPDYETCLTMLRENKADIVTNVFPGRNFRKRYQIATGLPYYNPQITLATSGESVTPGSGLRIGATREMLSVREAYLFIYPRDCVFLFASEKECRAALKRGEIDAYIPFYPGLPHSKDAASNLNYQITLAFYPMALGFNPQLPPQAHTVFSKGIAGLSNAEIESLLLEVPPLEGMNLLIYLIRNYYGVLLAALTLFFVLRIRASRKEVRRLKEVAYTDLVTQGINRACFLRKAAKVLKKEQPCYILSANIRHLIHINQLYGCKYGDAAIRSCYTALHMSGGSQDIVAHCGGGRFLCLWHEKNDAALEARLNDIFKIFSTYGERLGHLVLLTVGIVRVTSDFDRLANLVAAAETAQSSISSTAYKSSFTYYSTELEDKKQLTIQIENRMLAALEAGEFQVYIQPQFDLRSSTIKGGEALIRWQAASGESFSPDQFIPVFEQNGFIRLVDTFVLEQVCQWLRRRQDQGKEVVPISVNQSRALFLTENYGEKLIDTLRRYNISKELIVIEITEGMTESNLPLLLKNLRILRKNGIKIALDDFGKGYSSLAALFKFPIDILKLDKEFLENERYEQFLRPIIALGKELDMNILCEGIETLSQFNQLKKLGCAYGQGFLMAKPMPISAFERFMEGTLRVDIMQPQQ